jgi:hypothetical protein
MLDFAAYRIGHVLRSIIPPWVHLDMAAGVVKHGAPTGDGREHAGAEEAQRASRVDRAVALRYE